jgi:hypothetical protein
VVGLELFLFGVKIWKRLFDAAGGFEGFFEGGEAFGVSR